MDIVFRERYDKALMQRAVFLASAPSRLNTLLRWSIALVIIVGTPFILHEAWVSGEEMSPVWLLRRLFVLAIGLYYLFGPYVKQRRMADDMWRKEQASSVTTGRITPQGIGYGDGDSEVSYPWVDFARLREDQKTQLLVLTTTKGIMVGLVPGFFENEQDWTRAKQLVQLKVVQPS